MQTPQGIKHSGGTHSGMYWDYRALVANLHSTALD
jgi:hypothetical protein